jgi:hypothetical protein
MKTIIGGDAAPVVWYRVTPTTPAFSGTTAFRSRHYHEPPDNDGIGEQSDGRICCGKRDEEWYRGNPPADLVPGPHPCGSDAVARTGAGPSDPTFMTGPDGSAPCCAPVPVWGPSIVGIPDISGEPRTFGDFPPSGVTVHWADDEGHSGSFISSGTFTTVPYGFHSAASYFLSFTMTPFPPTCVTIWPVSMSDDRTVAWGKGYVRRVVRFASGGFVVTTTYTW